jgi:hypothetical protein
MFVCPPVQLQQPPTLKGRHVLEHFAGTHMASLWATGSFSRQSIASSMLVGASLGLACDGTGAASGGVVVDADEVATACCIVNRFHEERKSAAMASSDLYKSAIFLLESDNSLHESLTL